MKCIQGAGPNFKALLTISKESALAEAGNSVLTSSIFLGLAGKFGLCACVLHVTRYSTQIVLKFGKQRMVIVSAEFGGKQSHETGFGLPKIISHRYYSSSCQIDQHRSVPDTTA